MKKLLNGWTKHDVLAALDKLGEAGQCQYLDDRGKRCVVGCFFKKETIKRLSTDLVSLNKDTVCNIVSWYPEIEKELPFDLKTCARLQNDFDNKDVEDVRNNEEARQFVIDEVKALVADHA